MKNHRYIIFIALSLFIVTDQQGHCWSVKNSYLGTLFNKAYHTNPFATVTAATGIVCAALYGMYTWIKTPYIPSTTPDSMNITTLQRDSNAITVINHTKGIPERIAAHDTIVIFCPGFPGLNFMQQNNIGERSANHFMKLDLIPTRTSIPSARPGYTIMTCIPCITFDFFDNRSSCNLGQNLIKIVWIKCTKW